MPNDRRKAAFPQGLAARSLLVIVITAFVRSAVVFSSLSHFGPRWFFARGSEMGLVADAMLRGHGLSSPFGPPTGLTAIVAPGYPLLVSLVFWIFGAYTRNSALCLMLLNVVLNAGTAFLVYWIGRRLAGDTSAMLVALFSAVSPPLVWMPTIFWETNLSALLLLVAICISWKLQSTSSSTLWATFGAFSAASGLVNPALLPSVLALMAYACYRQAASKRRSALIFAALFAIVFAPWPLRNVRHMHALILTRTTLGLELWMGNHSGGEGYLEPTLFPTYNVQEFARYRQLGELRFMAEKKALAFKFLASHPGNFFRLSLKRALRFWTGSGSRPSSLLFSLHGTLSAIGGLAGLTVLWQRRGSGVPVVLLGVPLLLFPLPYYVTHAEFKYRLILDPLLMILAAVPLEMTLTWLRNTQKLVRDDHRRLGAIRDAV